MKPFNNSKTNLSMKHPWLLFTLFCVCVLIRNPRWLPILMQNKVLTLDPMEKLNYPSVNQNTKLIVIGWSLTQTRGTNMIWDKVVGLNFLYNCKMFAAILCNNGFCAITFILVDRYFWIFNTMNLGTEYMLMVDLGDCSHTHICKRPLSNNIPVDVFYIL